MLNSFKCILFCFKEQSQKTQETKFRKKMLKTYTEESNYKAAKMHLEDGNAYWLNTFGAVTKTPWAKYVHVSSNPRFNIISCLRFYFTTIINFVNFKCILRSLN